MEGFPKYLRFKGLSKSTRASTIFSVSKFYDWIEKEQLEVEEIRYQDILEYIKQLQVRGLSQRTIQHYLNDVSHYFEFLLQQQEITSNPVPGVKIKGVKRKILYHILEPTELQQLYSSYPDTTIKLKRDKIMLGLLCFQGNTTNELGKLEVNHIDLRLGTVFIPGGRKSNERTLELMPQQVFELHEYINQIRPTLKKLPSPKPKGLIEDKEYLIIGEGGRNQHFSNLVASLTRNVKAINSKITSLRQIRASVITKWLKQHNKRKAQYLSGHRFISSTEAYEQHDVEELKEEIEQFHPLN